MMISNLLSGEELVLKHINSAKGELPSKGLKEYCPNNSWLERKQIENHLEEKYQFLKTSRIEKSSSLSHAEWIPHLKKAKVTKRVGKFWFTHGHHQENEDWLLPEEALFLVENCELRLFYGNLPLSIEDCYRIIFNEDACSLDKFRVFSYLSRAGFIVIHHSPAVSVTRYEKQVKLEPIIQSQKRPPPEAPPKNDVPIKDEDCFIVEKSSVCPAEDKKTLTKSSAPQTESISCASSKKEQETIILIDSDSDDDVVTQEIDDDSDSEVVCISSPSYVSNENCRNWYPLLAKSLRITMEKFIDLSNDDEIHDNKWNVRNNFDLIRMSKAMILSHLPNVKDESDTFIVADKRLLPPNVLPKFSEYKLSLDVRPDSLPARFNNQIVTNIAPRTHPVGYYNAQSAYNNSLSPFPGNLNGSVNQMGLVPDVNLFSRNPLLLKAQEMQALAVNMMETAVNLMTAMSAAQQNPNELWELRNQVPALLPSPSQQPPRHMYHHPLYNQSRPMYNHSRPSYNQNRPMHQHSGAYGFPRAPRGFFRRSNRRRHNWTPVRPNYNLVPLKSRDPEVVILSDNEEETCSELISSSPELTPAKRKNEPDSNTNKRLKIERTEEGDMATLSDSSSCIMENPIVRSLKKEYNEDNASLSDSSSCVMECLTERVKKEPDSISKEPLTKKVKLERNVEVKKEIKIEKEQNNETIPDLKKESDASAPLSLSNNISIKSENINSKKVDDLNSVPFEKKVKNESEAPKEVCLPLSECDSNGLLEKTISVDLSVEPLSSVDNETVGSSNVTLNEKPVSRMDVDVSNDSSVEISVGVPSTEPCGNPEMGSHTASFTTWEQVKNAPPVQIPDDEEESLLDFQDCVTYGDVLKSLKIFKKIDAKRQNDRLRISYDVYLSEAKFKKSLKILPKYRVIVLRPSDELPSSVEIEELKFHYQDNVPFLFSIVFNDSIRFYLFDSLALSEVNI